MSTDTSTPRTATTAPTSALRKVAAVVAALLAVVDIAGVVIYLSAPVPIAVNAVILALAALTILGAVFAFRGKTWGVWLAAVTRFLSIVPMLPVLLFPDAPPEAMVPTVIQLIVTVVDIVVLIVVVVRRRRG